MTSSGNSRLKSLTTLVTIATSPIPQLQPNDGAPAGLTGIQGAGDLVSDGPVSIRAQHVNPRGVKRGAVIRFPKFGLVHYETLEPDLVLIARGGREVKLS